MREIYIYPYPDGAESVEVTNREREFGSLMGSGSVEKINRADMVIQVNDDGAVRVVKDRYRPVNFEV